jgi:hypothetical protein
MQQQRVSHLGFHELSVTEKANYQLLYTRGLETVNAVQFGNHSEEKIKVTFWNS